MPRGMPFKKRREEAGLLLLSKHPTMTYGQIARREGLERSTVSGIAQMLGIDYELYRKRIALVKKREKLLKNLEALDAQIASPITKENT